MKQLSLGSVVLLGLIGAIGPVAAQSTGRPSPSAFAAPVMPVYNWTGFYVGANLGGSVGRANTDFAAVGAPFGSTSQHMNGVLGGLQAGYNLQNRWAVFGLEVDFQGTTQRGTSQLLAFIPGTPGVPATPGTPGTPAIPCVLFDPPAPACTPGTGIPGTPGTPGTPAIPGTPATTAIVTYQNTLPWFGTVRGRIGVTPAERWLVYATGGLAYGEVTTAETLNVNGAVASFSSRTLRVGWTAGIGIEAVIIDRWTVKFEYLYIDLGNVSANLIGIAPITLVAANSRVTDNVVRVGFNYSFGAP